MVSNVEMCTGIKFKIWGFNSDRVKLSEEGPEKAAIQNTE